MRQGFAGTDLKTLNAGLEDDIARVQTAAIREETGNLKGDWRDQIQSAGLGQRLARTIRDRTYPLGHSSVDAAGWIWTKAPLIIDTYDKGPLILPKTSGGRYLAIPSKNVPNKGRRRMTPVEVEAAFNQDLIIRRGPHGTWTAWVDVNFGSYSRRMVRARGTNRKVRRGKPKLVFMFTLTRWVKVKARLSLQLLLRQSEARYPSVLTRHWSAMPNRAAPMRGT